MFAVHGVFRDTLGAAPTLVGGIAPGDAERVALIANYYENILSFLHTHHEGEEVLVFPLLRERCDGAGELMDRMAEEHHEALELLEQAKAALAAWPGGDAAAQQATQERLDELGSHLNEHLLEEEQKVLPLAGANLSMEEWGAMPAHGMAAFDGDKIWLDPRPHPGAHDRRAAGGDDGAHAAAGTRDVDRLRRAGLQGVLDGGRGGGGQPRLSGLVLVGAVRS